MKEKNNKVICLMGPTASGKTDLAMQLYRRIPSEIISVDSAMIYRNMDIGTAKPSLKELNEAPHELIDLINPDESYSVAQFQKDALSCIERSIQNGRTPILVGGTMMYFKSLIEGLSALPNADDDLRHQIMTEASVKGWKALHDELSRVDSISAKKIHANDPQRIVRALEVFRLTGKPLSELTSVMKQQSPYHFVQFSLIPESRELLHKRVEERFYQMIEDGFVNEVVSLLAQYSLNESMPSMRCVGYRQCLQYLEAKLTYDEMKNRSIFATRQLAKRQLTWLRGWKSLHKLESGSSSNLDKILKQF
jgi:tRNA dimethylallyltransferase